MKKIIALIISLALICLAFAFDWPQKDVTKNSISSYFGQNRGEIISTSIVLSDDSEVKAAESGHLLMIMIDEEDDTDFFPTTLGSSVIIAHEDNLLSVYGNINPEPIMNGRDIEAHEIKAGEIIGTTEDSGWDKTNGNFEFQIVDTNNNTAINPKILMPRAETELPLTLSGIKLQNKTGTFFDINKTKSYASGPYRIYQKRNDIAVPYKTSVAINGVTVDQITYDTISQENGKSFIIGKKKYTSSVVYPTPDLQLLGEANLTPGKATLSLYVDDIKGKTKQLNYNISIY